MLLASSTFLCSNAACGLLLGYVDADSHAVCSTFCVDEEQLFAIDALRDVVLQCSEQTPIGNRLKIVGFRFKAKG